MITLCTCLSGHSTGCQDSWTLYESPQHVSNLVSVNTSAVCRCDRRLHALWPHYPLSKTFREQQVGKFTTKSIKICKYSEDNFRHEKTLSIYRLNYSTHQESSLHNWCLCKLIYLTVKCLNVHRFLLRRDNTSVELLTGLLTTCNLLTQLYDQTETWNFRKTKINVQVLNMLSNYTYKKLRNN